MEKGRVSDPSMSLVRLNEPGPSSRQSEGKLKFRPYSPPLERYGRWLCMDVKDFDGDGDPDIVLGNFADGYLNETKFSPPWRKDLPFIVLENKTR